MAHLIGNLGGGFAMPQQATRIYAEKINRRNREHRSNGHVWCAELARIEKQIQGSSEAITDGMYQSP